MSGRVRRTTPRRMSLRLEKAPAVWSDGGASSSGAAPRSTHARTALADISPLESTMTHTPPFLRPDSDRNVAYLEAESKNSPTLIHWYLPRLSRNVIAGRSGSRSSLDTMSAWSVRFTAQNLSCCR